MEAMEPPPAPISTISTTGVETSIPDPFLKRYVRAISNTFAVFGAPSSTRQIFAVVPPMSKDSAFATPCARAYPAAKIAPPAGPDSSNRTGCSIAVSTDMSPPPEWSMNTGAPIPASFSRATRRPR
jgi:hypothetical protein